jgi:hypothetical protein
MDHPFEYKERFFCLLARDYIAHEIDENIKCRGYKSPSSVKRKETNNF